MKRNTEAIRTKSNASHAAITELTNIALIAAEKADKAETAEVRNPVVSPEAYSRIEDEAIRLAKKVAGLEEAAKHWEYEYNCAQGKYQNAHANYEYWKAECEKARAKAEELKQTPKNEELADARMRIDALRADVAYRNRRVQALEAERDQLAARLKEIADRARVE